MDYTIISNILLGAAIAFVVLLFMTYIIILLIHCYREYITECNCCCYMDKDDSSEDDVKLEYIHII